MGRGFMGRLVYLLLVEFHVCEVISRIKIFIGTALMMTGISEAGALLAHVWMKRALIFLLAQMPKKNIQ